MNIKKAIAVICAAVLICSCLSTFAESWTCPSCGTSNSGNFCYNCGAKRTEDNRCPDCGALIEGSNYVFCPECGTRLKGETVPAGSAGGVISSSLLNGHVGDTVIFGKYEQNAYTADGKEDIEWIILDEDGSKKLLISKYGLDCVMYNDEWTEVTWATSSVRTWLNSTFLNTAFSDDEQKLIVTTHLTTSDNTKARTKGGADTEDKVFFLSVDEAITILDPTMRDSSWLRLMLWPEGPMFMRRLRAAGGGCVRPVKIKNRPVWL